MTSQRCRVLVVAALLCVGPAGCKNPVKPREVESIASATLADLASGAVKRACSRIYEPPDWNPGRAAEDREQIGRGVEAIMNETGTLSDARVINKWLVYQLEVTGADPQYWLRRPNMGVDSRVTYAVNFSKVGPGVLSLTFTRLSGRWELRSILFGFDTSTPGARDNAIRIGRTFIRTMDPRVSAEQLDQMAAQMIGAAPH